MDFSKKHYIVQTIMLEAYRKTIPNQKLFHKTYRKPDRDSNLGPLDSKYHCLDTQVLVVKFFGEFILAGWMKN